VHKLLPQVSFAIVMLVVGVATLLFPHESTSWMLRVIGEKKAASGLINSRQAIWSIRCAGAGAILMGVFVLWASLRSY
jgi:uncharacterized membrane protein HdeD (DUF308 family)